MPRNNMTLSQNRDAILSPIIHHHCRIQSRAVVCTLGDIYEYSVVSCIALFSSTVWLYCTFSHPSYVAFWGTCLMNSYLRLHTVVLVN
jgi:hypothetical protein